MMFPIDENVEFTRRILHRVKMQSRTVIPPHIAQTANFEMVSREGEIMLLTLTAEVLRDHVVSETKRAELNIPSSWWQAFKQTYQNDWWLRRFVKRYPVVFTTMICSVHFDRYYNYPEAAIALPEDKFGKFIIYETTSVSDWGRS
jgi:hypothetical protein